MAATMASRIASTSLHNTSAAARGLVVVVAATRLHLLHHGALRPLLQVVVLANANITAHPTNVAVVLSKATVVTGVQECTAAHPRTPNALAVEEATASFVSRVAVVRRVESAVVTATRSAGTA